MGCCTPRCQKWTLFSVASVFVLLGIVFAFAWQAIYDAVLRSQLNVGSRQAMEFGMFEETPIPMYIEFYLFNWTNYEEVVESKWNPKTKLKMQQCGPYTYSEHHIRKGIIFNDNNTITFQTERIWKFLPEKSNGSLSDPIRTINPVVASIGYIVKHKHAIVDIALDFVMREKRTNFTVTKSAGQWLFDGYDDPLLDLVHKLNLSSFHVPFKKFGWFVERNESISYDGTFTMMDGTSEMRDLGRLTLWNGAPRTEFYDSYCGMVNGTMGELFYPVEDDTTASIFASDVCSTLTLTRDGDETLHGIQGNRYVATERVLDNGTKYPEMACFSPGEVSPSGIRNVSECKFGAPAFVSFPHFYLADPSYLERFEGLHPDKSLHEFHIGIEPNLGIPLTVQAAMQINLKLTKVKHIKLLENVEELYVPCMWFRQTAELDEDLATTAKLLLILPEIGEYTGYGLLGLGVLLFSIGAYITYRKGWKAVGKKL